MGRADKRRAIREQVKVLSGEYKGTDQYPTLIPRRVRRIMALYEIRAAVEEKE